MGHFFITGPEREHPFHASNVRGRRDLKANPKMSEEYRNVRGEFGLLPSTNRRDGSVSHAPRTHVPLHSRSADTHLTSPDFCTFTCFEPKIRLHIGETLAKCFSCISSYPAIEKITIGKLMILGTFFCDFFFLFLELFKKVCSTHFHFRAHTSHALELYPYPYSRQVWQGVSPAKGVDSPPPCGPLFAGSARFSPYWNTKGEKS